MWYLERFFGEFFSQIVFKEELVTRNRESSKVGLKIEKERGSLDLASKRMRVVKYPKCKKLRPAKFVYLRCRGRFNAKGYER